MIYSRMLSAYKDVHIFLFACDLDAVFRVCSVFWAIVCKSSHLLLSLSLQLSTPLRYSIVALIASVIRELKFQILEESLSFISTDSSQI